MAHMTDTILVLRPIPVKREGMIVIVQIGRHTRGRYSLGCLSSAAAKQIFCQQNRESVSGVVGK